MAVMQPVLMLPGVERRTLDFYKVGSSDQSTNSDSDLEYDSDFGCSSSVETSPCPESNNWATSPLPAWQSDSSLFLSASPSLLDIENSVVEQSARLKTPITQANWREVGQRIGNIFRDVAMEEDCGFEKDDFRFIAAAAPLEDMSAMDHSRWHVVGERLARVFQEMAMEDDTDF
eukprot:gnl/MRDRNA2_/MRDRNA2_111233_c0_seq1.p1 gnl/MRDRNA2_/MRDRNA2_111233_c0~~gnl/MRDRNA2_/MRDRNA2_111233_c0_seq1.p1  ORF type:complete len:204 (+),score=38.07 gnl/MRDRNA2_/MRDRNA2_111233_c0_seq1:91-612(+)